MGVAHFAKTVAIGQIREDLELIRRDIAGGLSMGLENDSYGTVTRLLVSVAVTLQPILKQRVFNCFELRITFHGIKTFVGHGCEVRAGFCEYGVIKS